MEILNQKERTKALGFFVLFFTLAVLVIILALMVNIYFPFKDMYKQIPKDSPKNKNMYNNTILVYKELIDAKKQIKQLTINQKTLDSLSTINKALKEEYDKMKVDLEVCKQLYQQE